MFIDEKWSHSTQVGQQVSNNLQGITSNFLCIRSLMGIHLVGVVGMHLVLLLLLFCIKGFGLHFCICFVYLGNWKSPIRSRNSKQTSLVWPILLLPLPQLQNYFLIHYCIHGTNLSLGFPPFIKSHWPKIPYTRGLYSVSVILTQNDQESEVHEIK